jgi:hypothetical protein
MRTNCGPRKKPRKDYEKAAIAEYKGLRTDQVKLTLQQMPQELQLLWNGGDDSRLVDR